MRVAQVVTQSRGGPVDHALELAVELTTLGHEVCVFGPAELSSSVRSLARVSWRDADIRSMSDVRGAIRFARALGAWRPELVHCQDRRAGLHGRLVARLLRVPSVYSLHGAPDTLAHLVRGNARIADEGRLDRLMYLHMERLLARLSGSQVVVASQALADYAEHAIGIPDHRLSVVPNGVDLDRFRCHVPDGGFRVVWVGLMVPVKRLDVLLRAMALASGIRLDLVGDGPLKREVEAEIARLGIGDRVTLRGFQRRPEKWLGRAHVVLLTSDAENCPLSILQGMASGCAVVATAVGGVPELVRDGMDGVLVEPGDPRAVATALQRLQSDQARLHEMQRSAVRRAESFAVRAMARTVSAVYEEVIGRAHARR
jgi:glycosyltransferase involved in cell wall biosynthesis